MHYIIWYMRGGHTIYYIYIYISLVAILHIIYYMQHMCGIINHHILTLGWPVMGISTHILFKMAPPRTCRRSYRLAVPYCVEGFVLSEVLQFFGVPTIAVAASSAGCDVCSNAAWKMKNSPLVCAISHVASHKNRLSQKLHVECSTCHLFFVGCGAIP